MDCLIHPGMECAARTQQPDRALTILERTVARTINGDLRPLLRVDTTNRPDLEDLRRVLLSESGGTGDGVCTWHTLGPLVVLEGVFTSPVRLAYSLSFPTTDRALLDAASRCGWLGIATKSGALITWLDMSSLRAVLAQLDTLTT